MSFHDAFYMCKNYYVSLGYREDHATFKAIEDIRWFVRKYNVTLM